MTLDELIPPGAEPEVLGSGYGFCEGPAADCEGNVYFSDGRNDAIHCWRPGRPVERFTGDSTDANGMMFNARGQRIYRYDVPEPGRLAGETLWIDRLGANPDGMTLDEHDNLYICLGRAGVKVFARDARPIGAIDVPYASNCCFGGGDFRTLLITSGDKFLGIRTNAEGLKPLPARETLGST